ncbi:MAG: tRNA uracil 4-sulfurtransferase ThiI [Coriobacteriia bacterium]|nr:tRNA uracil 4-sulfurtransferase ThiI [Coriobacteriia bacterium]
MAERTALVHYHEIGLKGHNRGDFERRLETNLRRAVVGLTEGSVRRIASRLLVPVTDPAHAEELLAAVARTPGVSYLGYAIVCDRTPEAIDEAAHAVIAEEIARREADALGPVRTFAIESRRSATNYPERSMEISRRVGATVQQATGLAVDLSAPDLTCRIEVVQARAYVYARRLEGPGGLPVGVSGTVVALMSAGIDSPVAAWRVMRRGATIVGVHFSGRPQTSAHSEHYALELARVLDRAGGMARLYTVPFGDVQRRIALEGPEDLRVLLYRRFMVRIAEAIARDEGARALVTGESLGQVASQTLDNVAAVDAVATMPILRPLIGSDKQEIIDEACAIGTFELSTATDDDCCTLFMPRRPETHATPEMLAEAEALLDVEGLVAEALAGVTRVDFSRAQRRRPR